MSCPNLTSKDVVTASSSEGDEMDSDNQAMVAPKLGLDDKKMAKPKSRIGKIGGKINSGTESSKPAGANPIKVTGPTKIGENTEPGSIRMKQREPILKPSEPTRVGRPTMQPPSSSPIRETSQERANRKREQLKRELESKCEAGAKKKRKI